jgi:hypothetical protein
MLNQNRNSLKKLKGKVYHTKFNLNMPNSFGAFTRGHKNMTKLTGLYRTVFFKTCPAKDRLFIKH